MSARPATAVLVCALLLTCVQVIPTPAEGGSVSLRVFSDGSSQVSVVFPSPGTNSSVSITLPKAADLTRATVDITGKPYLENQSIAADTREDFARFEMSNLDINTSPGEVVLEQEFFATDEFGNSSLDSRWDWYNSPSSWDLGVTRPGWLHMVSPRNTNFNRSRDNGALVYQTLSGNFTIETRVNCTPQWNYQKAGIMVRQDQNNWVALKYQNQSGKRVQWSVKSNGNMWNSVNSGGQSASEMWLRLTREGSRWISFYSTNGASWTQLYDTNQGPAKTLNDPVRVGLLIADGGTWTYWPADFDYFNFSRYVSSGWMRSGALSTPYPVTQARATWNGPTSPINANFVLYVRTSAASPWERLMPNSTTPLVNPGTSPQLMFQMTSSGIRTPDLFDIQVNFSALLYPSGLSLALGAGAPFWDHPGMLDSTETVDLLQALSGYLATATPDAEGNVTVPLTLSCDSKGAPALGNLVIDYNFGVPPAAPELRAPGQGAFVPTLNPELRLACTDSDRDPLHYCVEVSGDGFITKTVYNQTTSTVGWSRLGQPYPSGEEALLTLSVPLSQGRTYAWRASAFDGAYWGPFSVQREFIVDATPPEGSVVLPDRYTGDPAAAGALLSFWDNESGVAGYEYMIGTHPGADNILPATATDNSTVTVGGLALQVGVNYYFSVRAQNRAGLWSAEAYSDPFQYWPSSIEPVGITIDSPGNGTEVSGPIQVHGTAWMRDGWGRDHSIQYHVDTEPWRFISAKGLDQTRTWAVDLDTQLLFDGPHVIQVRLVQGLINSTEIAFAESRVSVNNSVGPPPLEVTFWPSADETVTVQENSRVEFTVATASQNLSIQWYVDGEPRSGETFARFEFRPGFTMAGEHTVSVVVGSGNQTAGRLWNVTVLNVDRAPTAGILSPPPGARWVPGENITFNASRSSDPDPDDTLHYLWNLGDGTQLEGLEVVHAYAAAGNYTVTLTVSDGTLQHSVSVELTVAEPIRDITTGGTGEFPLALLFAGLALMVAAVAAGGFLYLRRLKTPSTAAKGPGSQRLYRLPRPSLVDDDEDVPRLRDTSGTDWGRLEREAAQTPPTLWSSIPEYRPSASAPAGRAPPAQMDATLTPPARSDAMSARAGRYRIPSEPAAQYRDQYSPSPLPPRQPTIPPPEETAFEDIPEVDAMPEEHIPDAPAEMVPEPPAQPYRPERPAAQPRPPQKPADPMDELMALLEKHK